MGYQRGDNRYGGDNDRSRYGERSSYRGYDRGDRWRGDDDRGFFDRAGDEVRSWFGDDEAERRRERDRQRYEREQGWSGSRDSGYGGGYYGGDYDRSGDRYASGYYGQGVSRETYGQAGGTAADTWGGSGFGGDDNRGRRFDRIDPGSVGTHGAHPMSSPVGGAYGAGYGPFGGYRSSAREAAMIGRRGAYGSDLHDPHYSEWRSRQIESLDRDYDEYRREHQSKFEQEFGGWREKRQGQRSSLGLVGEHMEVLGSDGSHIGTVDCVKGDRIVLTKGDESAGGRHHSIPCGWIESVDDKVTVNKSADEAMRAWKDEDHNRALFEREDQGSEGPHVLNRSFSGTY